MKVSPIVLALAIGLLTAASTLSAQTSSTPVPVEARIPVAVLDRTPAQALALAQAIYAILIAQGQSISAVTLTDSNDQTLASFPAAQLSGP